ncbi:MAG: ATP synthase F0 subunit C [Candidatus Binataceae bacterium]
MIRRIAMILGAITTAVLASPLLAMAQEGAVAVAAQAPAGMSVERGLIALGANLGIGIAAFGSGLGQGRMAASAMESIGRNPNSAGQLFVPMIIGLAFIEALTLYALVIAFFLQAKI